MKRLAWLRILRRIDAIRLEPGDILIVSTDRTLSREEWAEASAQLTAHFPDNKHLALPPGWSIQAVRGDNDA